MSYATQTSLGPEFTPRIIKILIVATCSISIGGVILETLFREVFGVLGPMSLLTLSYQGISRYYLWQPVTYLFAYGTGGTRVNLFWLIGLTINMYILWVMGSNILERVGTRPFLRLYFLSGILAAIVALLLMKLTGAYQVLGGPTGPILALLACWAVLNPESQILLFFVIPIKARWLVVGIMGVLLFIALANLDLVHFFFYLTGAGTGYYFSVIGWGYRSPFPITRSFDSSIERIVAKASSLIPRRKEKPSGKIFDFKTGKSVDDDDRFMDEMLDKISKRGKDSLSRREKRRMDDIAKRKFQK